MSRESRERRKTLEQVRSATRSGPRTKSISQVISLPPKRPGGTQRRRNIEEEPWYHGLRTRDDVACYCLLSSILPSRNSPLLRETGDFLVRASQSGDVYTLVLNVKNGAEIDNLTISVVDGQFTLHYLLDKGNAVKFPTVAHLIKYYRKHRLPNDRRLVKPVKRPWWLLRHAAVKYDESGKLGSGNFCDVFRGKVTIDNNEVDVAIKICHPPTQDISAAELLEARTSMIKEAKLMAEYKDANVIKFYGVACDRPPLMILMELCAGGSMDNHLRNRGKNISATEKLIYLYEISCGMRYLHSMNCVHRDLAARNCLISSEGVIKVADFGLSVILEQGHTMCRTIIKEAPIRWFAPECCYKEPSFSKKTDVWAFGSVMFEVFSNGSKPFLDVKDQAIIKAIRRAEMPDPPSETPAEATNLLKKIWVLNPDERPSFNGIGKHLRGLIQLLPQIEPGDMVVNQLKGVKRTVKLDRRTPRSPFSYHFSLRGTSPG
ncbi:hypothetical protein Y032_0091g2451 [Ancylostoma ceylanicum]|nr:hypothetical protein Y032_0091g2451 [Ancylostoma ceylanicum]